MAESPDDTVAELLAAVREEGFRAGREYQELAGVPLRERLAGAWEEGAFAGREYQKWLHMAVHQVYSGPEPWHSLNPYRPPVDEGVPDGG